MRFTLWRLPSVKNVSLSLYLLYINPKSSCGLSDSFLLKSRNRSATKIVRLVWSLRISRAHLRIVHGWHFATVLQVQTPGESGARVCADTVHECVFPPQPCWATASSELKNRQKGDQSKSPLLSVNYRYNELSLTRDVNVDLLVSLVKCWFVMFFKKMEVYLNVPAF